MLKRNRQSESFSDKIHHFRGVIMVISVPILLVSFVLFLMPSSSPADSISSRKVAPNHVHGRSASKRYAVIFDAGSSGSRVHVFCFDKHLDLVPIGKDLELFKQLKPGLSHYEKDPKAAADSLKPLLEDAESVIPRELHRSTPVRVGATAGLRQLQGDASDKILQAVRDFLRNKSSFNSNDGWVTVLDGNQEGAYQWVLETLDAVLDVGGVYDPRNDDRYDHHQKGFYEVFGHDSPLSLVVQVSFTSTSAGR